MPSHNNIWHINSKDFFGLKNNQNKINFLLHYAVLAPSTHNSQPWLFKVENNKCFLYPDLSKLLPNADPKSRDLYISLGCCLENLAVAARYFKALEKIEYWPSGHELKGVKPAAVIYFKDSYNKTDSNWQELIKAITQRVNARGIFRKKPVPPALISRIRSLELPSDIGLKLIEDKTKIKQLARLTAEGIILAYNQSSFRQEAADWINHSFSKRQEGIHSYALRMPALLSFIFPTIIRKFNIGKKLSQLNLMSVGSAALISVITSNNESPVSWLRIGRLAERLMLEFNAGGLNTSIFVAAVEMGELQQQTKQVIDSDKKPQFIFCVGYLPGNHKHTTRFHPTHKIINEKI